MRKYINVDCRHFQQLSEEGFSILINRLTVLTGKVSAVNRNEL